MERQAVKSVAVFVVVLMALSIIPFGALASENIKSANQTDSTNDCGSGKIMPGGMRHEGAGHNGMHFMCYGPAENITEENFAEVRTTILDSITERIAGLQSMYTNVSEAPDAEELQEVLLAERKANAERAGPCEMNGFPCKMCAPCLCKVENITDDNLTDVKTEIVDSIGNMTGMLNEQLENTTDENMTAMLREQITKLEELSANVSKASSAAGLQEVVLVYMKAQAAETIEKEIEHIKARISEARINESENSTHGNVTELNNKLVELAALIEDIEGAESFEELREIMRSGMKSEKGLLEGRGLMNEGKNPVRQGVYGKMPGRPCLRQDNSTEVSQAE
ncbi:hypothetical protein RSJ42_04715 [Methanosarcina hadiensis]|uniref:hypothetical protein n=1 Tax=Methanosarcina hadiensis TaxID=3078083 RepID=UPI0039776DD3